MSDAAEYVAQLSPGQRVKYLLKHTSIVLIVILTALASIASFIALNSYDDKRRYQLDMVRQSLRHAVNAFTISLLNDETKALRVSVDALPDGPQKLDVIAKLSEIEKRVAELVKAHPISFGAPPRKASFLISSAWAESSTKLQPEDVRLYGIIFILGTLGVVFFGVVAMIFFTKDPMKLTFAFDTVKILLGFFVGVATTFFGAAN